nr:hypothetical protein [Tanacetum cinerariifolium]
IWSLKLSSDALLITTNDVQLTMSNPQERVDSTLGLGHVLVRGLPSKVFTNDNSCVACKKGKQHRASCKSKLVSSVDQPLFRLHMDLFGPTFVKSLNETPSVLQTFIIGLKNLLSLKVKIIICDNGTEFKNADLNQFYRVLVTKPHNKTPYELLHGRLPSIGFKRPFGCPVTILYTLDPLGKFQGNVDEGFLVGYSVCGKAFRVFNSRTCIIQETLHVNFMENKPNVTGAGPAWLFDIDSLTQTMNYHPVLAENQSNSNAGDKTENKDKGKSHVVTITGFRNLNEEFAECINNNINGVNAAGSSVSAVGLNFTNSTNDFSAAAPLNADMPNLEDLSHNADDVGAEADINNMESIIQSIQFQQPESTKIIQPLKLLTFIPACFLSQEEPKRVHQALKDPSWIEAMQEELLQFKIQKVWILVDLPYGKRAIGT